MPLTLFSFVQLKKQTAFTLAFRNFCQFPKLLPTIQRPRRRSRPSNRLDCITVYP